MDPILLRPIRRRFLLLRNDVLIAYDAHSLHECIERTGMLCDPVVRGAFKTHELMRLARVCARPLMHADELEAVYTREVGRRSLISFLCNDVVDGVRNDEVLDENALTHIHEIASASELKAVHDFFTNNGLCVTPPQQPRRRRRRGPRR